MTPFPGAGGLPLPFVAAAIFATLVVLPLALLVVRMSVCMYQEVAF